MKQMEIQSQEQWVLYRLEHFYNNQQNVSEKYIRRQIKSLTETDRLVCNELRKEVQYIFSYQNRKTCDSVSIIQISSKSL